VISEVRISVPRADRRKGGAARAEIGREAAVGGVDKVVSSCRWRTPIHLRQTASKRFHRRRTDLRG
jgi:transposase